jgi:hypothetical protein
MPLQQQQPGFQSFGEPAFDRSDQKLEPKVSAQEFPKMMDKVRSMAVLTIQKWWRAHKQPVLLQNRRLRRHLRQQS